MDRIRTWMTANPEEGKALRRMNKSYVFFRETGLADNEEPIGAQGVSLTAGPLARGRPEPARLRHAVLHPGRAADRERGADHAVAPPDDRAGHRRRHRRAGARRHLLRRRRAGRPDLRPLQAARPVRHAVPEERRSVRAARRREDDEIPLPKPRPANIPQDEAPPRKHGAGRGDAAEPEPLRGNAGRTCRCRQAGRSEEARSRGRSPPKPRPTEAGRAKPAEAAKPAAKKKPEPKKDSKKSAKPVEPAPPG